MRSFAELFKKYRLKAEFETLCAFGIALAEEGRIYDDSTFTHWQNGKRTPRDRKIVLSVLKIFIERKGITSLNEANEFIASAGLFNKSGEIKHSLMELNKNLTYPMKVKR